MGFFICSHASSKFGIHNLKISILLVCASVIINYMYLLRFHTRRTGGGGCPTTPLFGQATGCLPYQADVYGISEYFSVDLIEIIPDKTSLRLDSGMRDTASQRYNS